MRKVFSNAGNASILYIPTELFPDQSGKALSYPAHLSTKGSFHPTVVSQESLLSGGTLRS